MGFTNFEIENAYRAAPPSAATAICSYNLKKKMPKFDELPNYGSIRSFLKKFC